MKLEETIELNKEKREIMIRLDKNDYESPIKKQMDLLRQGEVENLINIVVRRKLRSVEAEIPKVEQKRIKTFKEARAILVNKYTKYKNLTLDAREFVDKLVQKKGQGRDIMKELVLLRAEESVSDKDKQSIINKILRF